MSFIVLTLGILPFVILQAITDGYLPFAINGFEFNLQELISTCSKLPCCL